MFKNKIGIETPIIFVLILFSLTLRYITLDIPAPADSLTYWVSSSWVADGKDFIAWFATRLGIIIPVAIIQIIFGTHPVVFHITPAIFYFIFLITTFITARKWIGLPGAVIASIFIIFIPRMTQQADQLLPGIFESGYLSLSIYFFLNSIENRNNRNIILSAVFLFFAYASKITALLPVLPYLFVMYKNKYTIKTVFLFFSVLLIGYISEHIWFAFHGHSFGRLGSLFAWDGFTVPYFEKTNLVITNFFHLFKRYLPNHAGYFWSVYFVNVLITLSIWIFSKRKMSVKYSSQEEAIIAIVIGMLFTTTFFIVKLDPIVVISLVRRYFLIHAAAGSLLIAIIFVKVGFKNKLFKVVPVWSILVIFYLPLICITTQMQYEIIQKGINRLSKGQHTLQVEISSFNRINSAFDSGKLILIHPSPRGNYRGWVDLRRMRIYFLDKSKWGEMTNYREKDLVRLEADLFEHNILVTDTDYHALVNRKIYPDRDSVHKKIKSDPKQKVLLLDNHDNSSTSFDNNIYYGGIKEVTMNTL